MREGTTTIDRYAGDLGGLSSGCAVNPWVLMSGDTGTDANIADLTMHARWTQAAPGAVTTRVLIAGAVLIAYCRVVGLDSELSRYWRQYALIGVTNSTLPFMLFAFAALHLPASYSVILNAMTPLFTALLAVPLLGERLTAAKIAGLVVGVAGVALVSGAGPVVSRPPEDARGPSRPVPPDTHSRPGPRPGSGRTPTGRSGRGRSG